MWHPSGDMHACMHAARPLIPAPAMHACRYLRWLQEGATPAEAYSERAAVHCGAKCYLQAREDAQAAVAALLAQQRQQRQREQQQAVAAGAGAGPPREPAAGPRGPLALAYQRLGEACLAERGHEDRDCRAAAKAFMQAAALLGDSRGGGVDGGDDGEGASSVAVQEGLQQASEALSMHEMDQVGLRRRCRNCSDPVAAHAPKQMRCLSQPPATLTLPADPAGALQRGLCRRQQRRRRSRPAGRPAHLQSDPPPRLPRCKGVRLHGASARAAAVGRCGGGGAGAAASHD